MQGSGLPTTRNVVHIYAIFREAGGAVTTALEELARAGMCHVAPYTADRPVVTRDHSMRKRLLISPACPARVASSSFSWRFTFASAFLALPFSFVICLRLSANVTASPPPAPMSAGQLAPTRSRSCCLLNTRRPVMLQNSSSNASPL